MRALLQQFQESVTRAFEQLENYVLSLAARVDKIEATPVDQAQIDARVDALVSEYLAENPLPEIDPEAVRQDVAAFIRNNADLLRAQPDMAALTAFVDTWIREQMPRFSEARRGVGVAAVRRVGDSVFVDLTDGQTQSLGGFRGDNGRGVTGATLSNGDLILTMSDGQRVNVGRVTGKPGEPGGRGVGIETMAQDGAEILVTLTDNRRFRFKIPEPRQLRAFGPGGGVSLVDVSNTVTREREIYVNETPTNSGPAIVYTSVPGTDYYTESIHGI